MVSIDFGADASRGQVAKKQSGRRTEDRSDVAVARIDKNGYPWIGESRPCHSRSRS